MPLAESVGSYNSAEPGSWSRENTSMLAGTVIVEPSPWVMTRRWIKRTLHLPA